MNAYLLAAGKGTRLRPYTNHTPKCLVDIHGTPLLGWWLQLLEQHGIQRVLINTHHLEDQVEAYINQIRPQSKMDIMTTYEPVLLGSAGTLAANRSFLSDDADFLVAYADVLTQANLTHMRKAHEENKKKGALLTMALFKSPTPTACGIAEMDTTGRIISFVEKPEHPKSDLANAGIYIVSPEIFDLLPTTLSEGDILDIGFHLLPKLVNRMYGYPLQEYIKDIGSISAYEEAIATFPTQQSS